MNILYLDKEGGFGGSSRSLYFLVKHLDRAGFRPRVVSREAGPIAAKYSEAGVAHEIRGCPLYKPGKRKNLVSLAAFLVRLPFFLKAASAFGRMIREQTIDLIHFNHDGFFPYAIVNGFFWKKKSACHLRTMIPQNIWGRFQCRMIGHFCDRIFCISENEKMRFLELAGGRHAQKLTVVPNIAERIGDVAPPSWMEAFQGRFKALIMGNFAHTKGSDRAVEVARALKMRGRSDIVLIVCGEKRNARVREDAAVEAVLRGAEGEGLGTFLHLAGYQTDVEAVLKNCDAVVRLTRENDPWGRDVIEAIVNGKPVLATGPQSRSPYVENGVNGYLFDPFDAGAVAEKLAFLADHPTEKEVISTRNFEMGNLTFSGPANARAVESQYLGLFS